MGKFVLPDEDAWVLPPAWRQGLHHRRGGQVVPDPIPTGADVRLRDRLSSESVVKTRRRMSERTVIFDEALVAAGHRYLDGWESDTDPDPRGAAVAAMLTSSRHGGTARELVDLWVSRSGIEFTTRVAVELIGLITTGALWAVDPVPVKNYERMWRGNDLEGFYWLAAVVRSRLAVASDADYERATEILERCRTTPVGRIATSYLIPTRLDWVDADVAMAAEWAADETGGERFGWGDHRHLVCVLLLAASRVSHLEQLRGTFRLSLFGLETAGIVGTFMEGVGPDAAPFVADPFYRDLLWLHLGKPSRRDRLNAETVRLLAAVPTDEAFRTLLRETVEARRNRAGLLLKSGALTRFPVRALRILSEREPVHPLYTDLLGGLVLGEPRLLPAAAPSLPAPVLARAEEIVATGGAGIGSTWVRLLRRRGPQGQELDTADDEKRAIAALAAVPTEEALGLVVDHIDVKYFRPAFLTAAKRDPRLALRVLEAKAEGSEVAPELLRDHLLTYPEVASHGVASHGAVPDGVVPDGVVPDGVVPDGVVSDGVVSHGVASAGVTPEVLAVPPRRANGRAIRVPDLPEWLVVPRLPAVVLRDSGEVLSGEAARALCGLLAVSKIAEAAPGIADVRALCEPEHLAAFAWEIFEQWQAAQYPAKSNLAMVALALFGDDSTVPGLVALFPSWASSSMRVRTGMDVLAAIGTDLALTHLNRLSRKARTAGFRRFAEERLRAVATARSLRPEELADRIVPDLGLGDDGRTTLDYGPRRFTVSLDEQLQPLLTDQAGKAFSRLPRPAAADDRPLAAASYQRFAELKKDLKTLGAERTRALEEAMVMARRWAAPDFQRFLVRHPLMWQLTRRLLWATFDERGAVIATFRAAEDRTFADVDDKTWILDGEATVGLAHPWHFAAERSAWAELFADYAIIQPFPQVGRELFTAADADPASWAGAPVEGRKLFTLTALGWDFSSGHGALFRYWPGSRTAEIGFGPGYHWQDPDAPQHLTGVRVLNGGGQPAAFTDLGPIAVSEVIRDVRYLTT
ncbi:DUF4132 domain-containing protein [Actinoplanes sp. GCM10030250]|uniref:DUF4132 domain-containing protein n=1 Tax=Actinoplanes sp. GCM10030250 TaxID=3273376 RepID=UPI00360845F2